MKTFPEFLSNNYISGLWSEKRIQSHWLSVFKKIFEKNIDTWDYQWIYSVWINSGLCVIPNENLVSNIGFGVGATHTLHKNKCANLSVVRIDDIVHPQFIIHDYSADKYDNIHKTSPSFYRRIINRFFY